jgi:hypothetical protein
MLQKYVTKHKGTYKICWKIVVGFTIIIIYYYYITYLYNITYYHNELPFLGAFNG